MTANILITGGAGFIGTNLALDYLKKGIPIHIFDNLSRVGSKDNLSYLKKYWEKLLTITIGDIVNFSQVKKAVGNCKIVYHLAGQVAVTTSFINPRLDFEANALGTFNILEAARLSGKPFVIFASTNKVYGSLKNHQIKEEKTRYVFKKSKSGIDESEPLDFPSPYACSKGVADTYAREYYRLYGLPTVVFRQSCVYGPFQNGIVEQGWIAYLTKLVLVGKKITLFGNGKQVRDLLYIDDLISAYIQVAKNPGQAAGQVYNVGGGVKNSLSILEYLSFFEKLSGKKVTKIFAKERQGDQKVYYSNIEKLSRDLNWKPMVGYKEGIKKLLFWLKERKHA